LADEPGISRDRLCKWRSEFARHGDASFPGHGVERLSDEGRQVKKRRNTELELEILKKAIAVLQSTGCAAASGGSQGDEGFKKFRARLRCTTEAPKKFREGSVAQRRSNDCFVL
jgi:transposase-like protein